MTLQRCFWFALLFVATFLGGCASELPVYTSMSDLDALATIADRQAAVVSISAECDIDLTDSAGQNISLDAVLVAKPPGNLRLRAWKFGHAVFDLTFVDGHGWVMVPEEGQGDHGFDIEKMPARQVGQALELLGPMYFRTATPMGRDGSTLHVRGPALGRIDVECDIDRKTLTPRRFVVGSEGDSPPSELRLDDYKVIDNMVWPMRMSLQSRMGQVVVRVRELELNSELSVGVFTPPARAKALP